MKVKTNDLTGIALDWAVAKCMGWGTHLPWDDRCSPSSSWDQGGPIIEREGITVKCQGMHWLGSRRPGWPGAKKSDPNSSWIATLELQNGGEYGGWLEPSYFRGPTPLIAAMRCYVASKLGDVVDVPDELVS